MTQGKNTHPVQPDPDDQSGSAGRRTTNDKGEQGKDTGQDRYGQTGGDKKSESETQGQEDYRKSVPERSPARKKP